MLCADVVKLVKETLAFAMGEREIHVNTLSLGGALTPDYVASIGHCATKAGMIFVELLAEEALNNPLRKYGSPEEVALAVEVLLSPPLRQHDWRELATRWRVHKSLFNTTPAKRRPFPAAVTSHPSTRVDGQERPIALSILLVASGSALKVIGERPCVP